MLRARQGQSTVEYAAMFIIFAAALVMMKEYISRGYQGHMRGVATVVAGEQNYLGRDKMIYQLEDNKQNISKKDLDFSAGKVLGNDFAYEKGMAMGLTEQQTTNLEKTSSQNGIITVESNTRKQRLKREMLF